jgi:zinc transport system substrate-binding protein
MVSHYPIEFLVEQVGGDLVQVDTLTSPGAEPHDLELSPQQVGQVQSAATVFYLSGFQPAVDDVVPEADGTVVDLTAGLPLRDSEEYGSDPHVWLDPELMGQMATTVADALSQADPQNRGTFEANAQTLRSELRALDQEWERGTAQCEVRTMVVSHEAFGYLADRYGFVQKGIAGLSPETEPSAQAIADLTRFVRDNGVTTVYTETLIDPAVAQTIAAEAGAQTATLDPLEGPPATGDYLSAMRQNLQTVSDGQRCS